MQVTMASISMLSLSSVADNDAISWANQDDAAMVAGKPPYENTQIRFLIKYKRPERRHKSSDAMNSISFSYPTHILNQEPYQWYRKILKDIVESL